MKSCLTIVAFAATLGLCACDGKKSPEKAPQAAPKVTRTAPQEAGPPLVNGLYVQHNACPGEGCEYGSWRATQPVALRARPDDGARIVATLVPKERVTVLAGDLYLVPMRGVAVRTVTFGAGEANSREIRKGETVYRLGYDGEGIYNFWYRGTIVSPSMDDIDFVRLDKDTAARPVWWVQMKRANGQVGWVRDPDNFECVGKLGGDTDC